MDEHLDESSLLCLAALPADDAQRRAALAHCARCERCAALWQQQLSLLALLDTQAEPPAVSEMLLRRTQAAVAHAQEHRLQQRRRAWGWLAGAILSLLMLWEELEPGHALSPRIGLHCVGFELAFAAAAFAAGWLWSRAAARALGPATASLVAMTGALIGQALLSLRCPAEHTALHLLAFHVAGVAVATLAGGLAGSLAQRASRPSR